MAESQSTQGPATPVYILRGHVAPIHALHLFAQNLRLVSGDAEGWIVIWDLVTKRPMTVWKGHQGAVLEVKGFTNGSGSSEIYTHGRDHKLCVWRIRSEDEPFLDKTLPVDVEVSNIPGNKTQPWLVHSLPVNALNFCAFSMTIINIGEGPSSPVAEDELRISKPTILFAVPNALDSGGIDIFHLPSERRMTTIPSDSSTTTGMVMAVSIFLSLSGDLFVVSAYEDGHVKVSVRRGPLSSTSFEPTILSSNPWKWNTLYVSRPHTQPVLSLDISPSRDSFITSSADAFIIKHPIPTGCEEGIPIVNYKEETPLKVMNTKHCGQQGLRWRTDGRIFATAGWDSRVRVYSGKTMKELAVLKWHKEGCYSVAFGDIDTLHPSTTRSEDPDTPETALQTSQDHARGFSLATIQNQRNQKVQNTHWLAAGSKDGKISLWDIY
ncbi:hypothetical protein N7492_006135 [Penicillium capsulatum]|uniref:ASTRA-associated protein 1 n=1 Tax=Penicillium capsulatum TaxID=69766 RepID=A0A9W9I0W2_9EURO|nr:hypothetical protein N7492_006135 [Penicillium capsulatum]KAJ6108785.1 hypothetical protein N7512_008622 [Penicillium capsulatum]